MEYYIHSVPVFVTANTQEGVDLPLFCQEIEETLSSNLLKNVDVVYIGDFAELRGRNAAFTHGAIYMTAQEPTNFDMVENFVHEIAHSLEDQYGWQIYTEDLKDEFLGKRQRLYHLLTAEGFHINPALYASTEYSKTFDEFLANEVGYPMLLTLSMGLFVSPYGATSLQEYFANGFEKYILDNPQYVRDVSPVLYGKIEEIINDEA